MSGNWAGGYGGGGAWASTLNNCIVYYNNNNYISCSFNYSCTTPMPSGGLGNITNAPLFVDTNGWSNLRLQSISPCIGVGDNSHANNSTDLDGRPRIVGGTVDIGAYEFQPGISGAFIGWLQQFGLCTDGSADVADPDRDGHNNWQEWRCGTCPTSNCSVLRLLSACCDNTNVIVTWQSVAGVNYFLECSTNLAALPRFACVVTNLSGQPDTTSYTHTNAAGTSVRFYRIGVGN